MSIRKLPKGTVSIATYRNGILREEHSQTKTNSWNDLAFYRLFIAGDVIGNELGTYRHAMDDTLPNLRRTKFQFVGTTILLNDDNRAVTKDSIGRMNPCGLVTNVNSEMNIIRLDNEVISGEEHYVIQVDVSSHISPDYTTGTINEMQSSVEASANYPRSGTVRSISLTANRSGVNIDTANAGSLQKRNLWYTVATVAVDPFDYDSRTDILKLQWNIYIPVNSDIVHSPETVTINGTETTLTVTEKALVFTEPVGPGEYRVLRTNAHYANPSDIEVAQGTLTQALVINDSFRLMSTNESARVRLGLDFDNNGYPVISYKLCFLQNDPPFDISKIVVHFNNKDAFILNFSTPFTKPLNQSLEISFGIKYNWGQTPYIDNPTNDPYWDDVVVLSDLSGVDNVIDIQKGTLSIGNTPVITSEVTRYGKPVSKFFKGGSSWWIIKDFPSTYDDDYTLEIDLMFSPTTPTASIGPFNATELRPTSDAVVGINYRSLQIPYNQWVKTTWLFIASGFIKGTYKVVVFIEGQATPMYFLQRYNSFSLSTGLGNFYAANLRITKGIRSSIPCKPINAPYPTNS